MVEEVKKSGLCFLHFGCHWVLFLLVSVSHLLVLDNGARDSLRQ